MQDAGLTIGSLARAAQVGIETIRYYQRRNLLPTPDAQDGAFRRYPAALAERVRFIKRAQELGFSLEEIAGLLQLEEGADRASIRGMAQDKLAQIRDKIGGLQRMESVLAQLIRECESAQHAAHCPIISALQPGPLKNTCNT